MKKYVVVEKDDETDMRHMEKLLAKNDFNGAFIISIQEDGAPLSEFVTLQDLQLSPKELIERKSIMESE